MKLTFGVEHPRDAVGRRFTFMGYSATSVSRQVAVDGFTASGGALLEIAVPARIPALWVAGAGAPALRSQGELLLADGVRVHVYSHGRDGSVEVLFMEVI